MHQMLSAPSLAVDPPIRKSTRQVEPAAGLFLLASVTEICGILHATLKPRAVEKQWRPCSVSATTHAGQTRNAKNRDRAGSGNRIRPDNQIPRQLYEGIASLQHEQADLPRIDP